MGSPVECVGEVARPSARAKRQPGIKGSTMNPRLCDHQTLPAPESLAVTCLCSRTTGLTCPNIELFEGLVAELPPLIEAEAADLGRFWNKKLF